MMNRRNIFRAVFFCWCIVMFWSCASTGTPANKLYFKAEAGYQSLRSDAAKQKYRSYWMACIRQFEAVYKQDPNGPWAAAGLYRTGELYTELYKHSYNSADIESAEKIFHRIIRDFPSSAYRTKAEKALKELPETAPRQKSKSDDGVAKKQYFAAESAYNEFKDDAAKKKYRSYWMNCIQQFHAVYQKDPSGPWAAAGLFMEGQLYEGLYRYSRRSADLDQAKAVYQKIVDQYNTSAYSDRARDALMKIAIAEGNTASGSDAAQKSVAADSRDRPEKAESPPEPSPSGPATVTGIRYWSNPEYTRVVVDMNKETDFQNNLLKKDPRIHQKHQRLYVDLKDCRLGKDIDKKIPINDSLLKDVRAGQYTPGTVRVVVDIKSFDNYNIFSLNNPFRIIIDVHGKTEEPAEKPEAVPTFSSHGKESKNVSIARQLALGVRRIVIDPGHGGKDHGAPGALHGVCEKEVTLKIAKDLARRMRKQLHCQVILTRQTDRYLTLEERTAIANTKKADLFISIHANASTDANAYGIETYYLNLTTDNESIAVAARENATSKKNISELQEILNDLMRNAKINESSRLATYVQNAVCKRLSKHYSQIDDRGVKRAPFYVLLGARMPSILIETSFITNKRECRRLINRNYENQLCEGIIAGVKRYIKAIRPTAFISHPAGNGSNG